MALDMEAFLLPAAISAPRSLQRSPATRAEGVHQWASIQRQQPPATWSGAASLAIGLFSAVCARASARGAAKCRGPRPCCPKAFRGARVARSAALCPDPKDEYIDIAIERKDGPNINIEIQSSYTILGIKTAVQLEVGLAEDGQQLFLGDVELADDQVAKDCGIEIGSVLRLEVRAEEQQAEVPDGPVVIDGVEALRLLITCEMEVTKKKTLTFYFKPDAPAKEVKEKAFEEFCGMSKAFAFQGRPQDHALFKLSDEPLRDKIGNVRFLTREERVKEVMTLEELGFKSGEELMLANRFLCP